MNSKRYEVIDKITGNSYGIYTDLAVNKIGFNSIANQNTFIIKEVVEETEWDIVIRNGGF